MIFLTTSRAYKPGSDFQSHTLHTHTPTHTHTHWVVWENRGEIKLRCNNRRAPSIDESLMGRSKWSSHLCGVNVAWYPEHNDPWMGVISTKPLRIFLSLSHIGPGVQITPKPLKPGLCIIGACCVPANPPFTLHATGVCVCERVCVCVCGTAPSYFKLGPILPPPIVRSVCEISYDNDNWLHGAGVMSCAQQFGV